MASVGETGGGRNRGLNPEVNLVPFIDLLSVCICFLLVSAVWLQLGSVQIKQALGTEAPVEANDQFDLTIQFESPFVATVELKHKGAAMGGWKVVAESKESFTEAFNKNLDEKVAALSEAARANPPLQAKDLFASATIAPAPNVPYKSLIMAMDSLRKREVINLAVMPKEG